MTIWSLMRDVLAVVGGLLVAGLIFEGFRRKFLFGRCCYKCSHCREDSEGYYCNQPAWPEETRVEPYDLCESYWVVKEEEEECQEEQ